MIEAFRVELEEIEELVLTKANESLISKLMHVRSNINRLHEFVWLQRDEGVPGYTEDPRRAE